MLLLIKQKIVASVWKQWNRFSADWQVLLEQPVSTKDLTLMVKQTSIPSFGFFFMLTLSAVIATFGLLSNSAATIIGAMIVAPLMGPIVSSSYSIVTADYKLLRRSVLTIVIGTAAVIGVAAVSAYAVNLRVVGSEILARTNPTLLDLGVAMAAGAAGAFALTRKSIANALAGVAIAVALVPPLCVLGIGLSLGTDVAAGVGLSLGDRGIIPGSFLLFATNLVGIVVSAGLVFLFHGYGDIKRAVGGLVAAVVSMMAVSYPLGFSFNRLLVRNEIYHSLAEIQRKRPALFEDVDSYSWNVQFVGDSVVVEMDLVAPPDAVNSSRLTMIGDAISQDLVRPVELKFRMIPINVVELNINSAQMR